MKAILFAVASIFVVTVSVTPSEARPYHPSWTSANSRTVIGRLLPAIRVTHITAAIMRDKDIARGIIGTIPPAAMAPAMPNAGMAERLRALPISATVPAIGPCKRACMTVDPPAGAAGGCGPKKVADLSSTLPATGGLGVTQPARVSARSWFGFTTSA
jgi:hypothetical protein